MTTPTQKFRINTYGKCEDGFLSVQELKDDFIPKRFFYIYGCEENTSRGRHAHLTGNQFFVCMKGSLIVKASDMHANVCEETLCENEALFVPSMVWTEQIFKTKDTVLLVLCDRHYDNREDYIDDLYVVVGDGAFAKEVRQFFNIRMPTAGFGECVRSSFVLAIQEGKARKRVIDSEVKVPGSGVTLVHPSVLKGNGVSIGTGAIVMPGSVISNDTVIGDFVVVDKMCNIGHNVTIQEFSTTAPSCVISGYVDIGRRCYIGAGTKIKERIKICDDVITGIGSVVVKDITEPGTYVGVPAVKLY